MSDIHKQLADEEAAELGTQARNLGEASDVSDEAGPTAFLVTALTLEDLQ